MGPMTTQLITPKYDITEDLSVITRTQEITDEFLTECSDNRIASMNGSMGDWHQVASIPVVVVEKWLREGFDIYHAPLKDIMKKLHAEDLQAFLTTERRVI